MAGGLRRRELIAALPLSAAGGAAAAAQPVGVRPPDTGMTRPDKVSDPNAAAVNALARHALSVRPAQISSEVMEQAKLRVLDVIGCAFAGAVSERQDALARLAQRTAGAPEASLIGFPVRTAASQAAMVNAVSARAWDFEVMTVVAGDRQIESHHAPTTAMVALALAEKQRLSGRDFLTAMIVGDDVSSRVLASTGVDFGQGWSPPPLFATWGGVAIAGRLMGLSADQLRNAFGIAVDQIGGTGQDLWDGVTNWKLAQGAVSRNAIVSAELAAEGWTGMNDALHAPFGFYNQFTSGSARPDYIEKDLGRAFYAEAYFKPYPQCAATHPFIETAFELREAGLEPRRIAAVAIRVQPRTFGIFVAKPFSMERSPHAQANFSLAFAVSTALRHGDFRLEHYSEQAMADPQLLRLIRGTTIERMPEGEAGIEIELTLDDGSRLRRRGTGVAARMPSRDGSTRAQILDKFHRQLAFSGFVPRDHAEAIVRRVDALDREPDMQAFVRMLTRHSRAV